MLPALSLLTNKLVSTPFLGEDPLLKLSFAQLPFPSLPAANPVALCAAFRFRLALTKKPPNPRTTERTSALNPPKEGREQPPGMQTSRSIPRGGTTSRAAPATPPLSASGHGALIKHGRASPAAPPARPQDGAGRRCCVRGGSKMAPSRPRSSPPAPKMASSASQTWPASGAAAPARPGGICPHQRWR